MTDLAPRETAKSAVDWLKREDIRAEVQRAVPKHIDPDWFLRTAQTAILNTTDRAGNLILANAEKGSLLREMVAVAELGLVLNPALGEAWLIVDKNRNVQRRIGYQGLAKLTMQSGKVSMVNAQAVYANDICKISLGDSPSVTHELNLAAGDRGKLLGCYAVARLTDVDAPMVEWMAWEQIEAHAKRYSDGMRAGFGPWTDPLGKVEMARKTPFRRLCKWLPKSPQLERELAHEEEVDRAAEARDVTPPPEMTPRIAVVEPPREKPAATPSATEAPKQRDHAPKAEAPAAGPAEFAEKVHAREAASEGDAAETKALDTAPPAAEKAKPSSGRVEYSFADLNNGKTFGRLAGDGPMMTFIRKAMQKEHPERVITRMNEALVEKLQKDGVIAEMIAEWDAAQPDDELNAPDPVRHDPETGEIEDDGTEPLPSDDRAPPAEDADDWGPGA